MRGRLLHGADEVLLGQIDVEGMARAIDAGRGVFGGAFVVIGDGLVERQPHVGLDEIAQGCRLGHGILQQFLADNIVGIERLAPVG